jgi:hypothetical protein
MEAQTCGGRLFRAQLFLGAVTFLVACGPAEEAPAELPPATLTLEAFSVAPGDEVYVCQNFANPFLEDVYIQGFHSEMTPGSHHMLVGTKPFYSNTTHEDCSGTEPFPIIYGAQVPNYEAALPEGVAIRFPKTHGFRVQVHYLNTTTEYLQVQAKFSVRPIRQESVEQEAAILFGVVEVISVPPNAEASVFGSCVSELERKIIDLNGHMHKHGQRFTATHRGEQVYESLDWSHPPTARFDPPRDIGPSEPLEFQCDYLNTSNSTLTFGESAEVNEMCVLYGYFYPVTPGQEPFGIGCD